MQLKQIIRSRPWLGWGVVFILLSVNAALAVGPRRVLIVHSFGRDFAPLDTMSAAFRTELAKKSSEPVEFFEVSIATARFAEEGSAEPLVDYLRTLFANKRLDLIVSVAEPALYFCAGHRAELFPETPLLAHVDHRQLPLVLATTNATIVPVYIKIPVLLENILQVLPTTTNVVMVLGASPFERYWAEQCRQEFETFTNRTRVNFVNDLPLDKIREKLASLPPRSAVLYAMLAVDAAGVPYEQEKALSILRTAANAPVFGVFESQLGHGIVGGPLLSLEESGRQAAQTALRLLQGAKPEDIRVPSPEAVKSIYDWRELQRWQIDPARLPTDAMVRYQPASQWEEHQGVILTASGVIVAQMLTIAALLVHRARRRRSETALRESEQRLSLAADAAKLGLWVWDIARDEVWMSEEGRRLFGWGKREPVNFERFIATLHPDDRDSTRRAVRNTIEGRGDYEAQYRVSLPDKTIRWISAHGRVEFNASHKALRLRGVSVDITARKQAEAEAQRHQTELAHISRVSIMGELSASMAHELNQPLTAILTNSQAGQRFLAADQPDLAEFREILKDIAYDTTRARDVIRHLRALVKKSEPDFVHLDLNDTIREVVGFLHGDIVARNVRVALQLAPELPPIRGDRIQLQQTIINLLLNAFDAMATESVRERCVIVGTELEAPTVVGVTVRDHGPGIPADKLEKIFEPFYTTKREGMGMGLSVTRSIIEAQGGRIWAENHEHSGAVLRFTLPVV